MSRCFVHAIGSFAFTLIVFGLWPGSYISAIAESRVEIQRIGDEIQLTWTGGVLQTATRISGPWSIVGGATSPHKAFSAQGAFFRVQETYSLTAAKAGAGSGNVRSTGTGIDCGSDCGEVLLSGSAATLQAIPEAGSTFTGWSGDCAGSGDCQVVMDGVKRVTATFAQVPTGNAVVNGGFEAGALAGWQQQPGQLIYSNAELGVQAHSGQYMARLGFDQDNRRLARIGQQITLPNSTPLFLNFALWLYSEELCDVPYYDSISVSIAGQRVVNEERVCRGSDTGGWRRFSIGLDAVAGQTVPVIFEIYSADVLTSIMLLDDISVSSESWQ
jgi:hypothetical protein